MFSILRPRYHTLYRRSLSTLHSNPHIYVHPISNTNRLSLLPVHTKNQDIIIGTSSVIPPTPASFNANPKFLPIVQSIIRKHATKDPDVIAQAQTYASKAGSSLGSGGMYFPANHPSQKYSKRKMNQSTGDGAGGASAQGGMGGGGRGGYIHVSDQRNPPDFGRVAWPEDIFGSLEVDGDGNFVDDGNYQESGTYRIITREGILQLSHYLRERLIEELQRLEEQVKS